MNNTENALYFHTYKESYARLPVVGVASRDAIDAVSAYRYAVRRSTYLARFFAWLDGRP